MNRTETPAERLARTLTLLGAKASVEQLAASSGLTAAEVVSELHKRYRSCCWRRDSGNEGRRKDRR